MKYQRIAATVAAGLILAACGGGGGSTSDNGTTTPPATSPVIEGSIQSNTPTFSYGAATAASDAFSYLNAQRMACGFGSLAQSTQIDVAAQAHSDYISINNIPPTHFENQAQYPTGFTGNTPDARILAAGYPAASGSGSEAIGYASVSTYGTTVGRAAVMGLFLAPYHGLVTLLGDRDMGVGFNATTSEVILNFAYSAARPKQLLSSDAVATYPCAGTTGVLAKSYYTESPEPFAGRDLATTPIGHPIYVKVRDGQSLSLSQYELRKDGAVSVVPVLLLTKANDANNLIPDDSAAIVIPNVPLDINSTYTFTASGTNTPATGTAQAVNLSFSFTTGAY